MGCGEYRSLLLLDAYAKRRLWRYANPKADPFLSITGTAPSDSKLAEAKANEAAASAQLLAHQESCERCKTGKDDPIAT
jgi:hypothetical protein